MEKVVYLVVVAALLTPLVWLVMRSNRRETDRRLGLNAEELQRDDDKKWWDRQW